MEKEIITDVKNRYFIIIGVKGILKTLICSSLEEYNGVIEDIEVSCGEEGKQSNIIYAGLGV